MNGTWVLCLMYLIGTYQISMLIGLVGSNNLQICTNTVYKLISELFVVCVNSAIRYYG